MPTGIKRTSADFFISSSVTESALNTFTELEVALPLSSLDREVFVITGIIFDPGTPSSVVAQQTTSALQLTRQSATAILNFGDFNLVANSAESMQGGAAEFNYFSKTYGNQIENSGSEYVDIIATANMFVQVQGTNNLAAITSSLRVYGYRAKADVSVYSALLASELNA